MNPWWMPRPSSFGPSLQWDANLRRALEGLPPFPGPQPHPEEVEIHRREIRELVWLGKA